MEVRPTENTQLDPPTWQLAPQRQNGDSKYVGSSVWSKDVLLASILNFLVFIPHPPRWLLIGQGPRTYITLCKPHSLCVGQMTLPHLAGRDVEGSGPQIHPLKGVDEGKKHNHARPLRGAYPAQTEHDHPLIGGHNLSTAAKAG
jgi:hypothetical protein